MVPGDETADTGHDPETDPATTVREVTTDAEWDAAVPLLRQLWSDADPEFVRSWREEDDYHLFGLFAGGAPTGAGMLVGVVGVSVQRVLHHRRHAWVHDLVVDEPRRSSGVGTELLAFVERWADERDCEYVALANRLDNEDALSFYEAAGMERWGYVVEQEL
ncbi:GNAT family N-acetyltransferase [Haloglomus halophilum]|uniref:GNAT family N-acetyltransferase n=1 Tax=Haloglomus halophilum TaxID=2962672 RepID=UPI0020C994E4|nr:GNAT family N-acetyltransferase [Haloglomus halophilum]